MKYNYKISQTVAGKTKVKEGVIIGTSSAAATRELSEKIRPDASRWWVVCEKYTSEKKEIDQSGIADYSFN